MRTEKNRKNLYLKVLLFVIWLAYACSIFSIYVYIYIYHICHPKICITPWCLIKYESTWEVKKQFHEITRNVSIILKWLQSRTDRGLGLITDFDDLNSEASGMIWKAGMCMALRWCSYQIISPQDCQTNTEKKTIIVNQQIIEYQKHSHSYTVYLLGLRYIY